jgi:GT2 family glycosyltransferase
VQATPLVAIVILNYNGRHHLENFLPSVIASTYPNKKVYIADNASTDDSTIWVQQNHPDVEVITLKENYGFARGYNVALKQVEADYYCLLNSDVEVTRGWIEPVIALMQTNKKIAACQPKILSYHNRRMFEYAGACGGWIDSLGYPFSRGRVFDVCEEDKGQYDRTSQIFWASGAALFVKASAFQHMQGFDEYFFAHQEEIDLCWRMQLAGYTVMVCPASVVYMEAAAKNCLGYNSCN